MTTAHHLLGDCPLVKELHARGLVPDNCRRASVDISTEGAMSITYTVLLDRRQIDLLGDGLKAAVQPELDAQYARQVQAAGRMRGEIA